MTTPLDTKAARAICEAATFDVEAAREVHRKAARWTTQSQQPGMVDALGAALDEIDRLAGKIDWMRDEAIIAHDSLAAQLAAAVGEVREARDEERKRCATITECDATIATLRAALAEQVAAGEEMRAKVGQLTRERDYYRGDIEPKKAEEISTWLANLRATAAKEQPNNADDEKCPKCGAEDCADCPPTCEEPEDPNAWKPRKFA